LESKETSKTIFVVSLVSTVVVVSSDIEERVVEDRIVDDVIVDFEVVELEKDSQLISEILTIKTKI
jgi:hypothetical protein